MDIFKAILNVANGGVLSNAIKAFVLILLGVGALWLKRLIKDKKIEDAKNTSEKAQTDLHDKLDSAAKKAADQKITDLEKDF